MHKKEVGLKLEEIVCDRYYEIGQDRNRWLAVSGDGDRCYTDSHESNIVVTESPETELIAP